MSRREPTQRSQGGERDAAEPRTTTGEPPSRRDRWMVFVPAVVCLLAVLLVILLRVLD